MEQVIAQAKQKIARLLEGYVSEDEVCEQLNIVPRTLRKWRQQQTGPPFVNIGRDVFYPEEEFRSWLKSRIRRPVRSRKAA